MGANTSSTGTASTTFGHPGAQRWGTSRLYGHAGLAAVVLTRTRKGTETAFSQLGLNGDHGRSVALGHTP